MLCWWPYAIVLMVGVENKRILDDLILLPYLNSLINPCLYMIINRDVRRDLKNFFCCNRQGDQAAVEFNSSSFSLRGIKKVFTQEQN